MKYPKSAKYDRALLEQKMMGPNPIKLLEELLIDCPTKPGAKVMDLGSGSGLTSIFLAKEYSFCVVAADLWSEPSDNDAFFSKMGLSRNQIYAVKADALSLPFESETFDAIVSIDSFHYFANEAKIVEEKIVPFVKKGGYIYIAVPGFVKDFGDETPQLFRLGWSDEELAMIHDVSYWKRLMSSVNGVEIISVHEMVSNQEVWQDWLACDNEYAAADKIIMDEGAAPYLNFIGMILKRI